MPGANLSKLTWEIMRPARCIAISSKRGRALSTDSKFLSPSFLLLLPLLFHFIKNINSTFDRYLSILNINIKR